MSAAIRREIPGGDKLEIAAPGEIRAASLSIFDRTFAVTYALELAAVVIGLVGLSSSFGALVLARRREFGMLRHIGMTRRQIGAMLATEGVAVSGIGLLAGVGLGWLIGLILIHVVNRQSFHWGMELSVPWLPLGGFAVADAGAGDGDGSRQRAPGHGRRRRARGEGGLVSAPGRPKCERLPLGGTARSARGGTDERGDGGVKRRAFLASPLLLVAGAARAVDYPRVMPGTGFDVPARPRQPSRIPHRVVVRHGPGSRTPAATSSASRSRSFVIGRALRKTIPAPSRHGNCCSRTRRWRIPGIERLRHDQRAARAGFGLAEAREETTNVRIGDWSLALADGVFAARIAAREFAFDLRFALTQALLPEGDGGYSRKGPDPRQASYYYSCPQLAVSGDLTVDGRKTAVTGHRVARSRMVERIHGGRRGGLGLDRHQSRRRRRR